MQRLGPDGTATAVPNPRGLLVLDASGLALELVTRGGRAPYAANQPTPAEAQIAFSGFQGFWGRYSTDPTKRTISYRPEGAVNPNWMGQELLRSYELSNDRLTVTTMPESPDGKSAMRWVWERVPELETISPANRRLIGFWQHVLERRVDIATGALMSETRRAPSIIVYTASGHVGVHFPPLNRQRFAADQPTGDEARAAIAGYVGYYGSYTLHPGVVFHHRLATLGASQGDTLKRPYEMSGSELTLRFPPGTIQGQLVRTEVVLKRIGDTR